MKFDLLALGDHLPDPHTGEYVDTQTERFRMWVELGVKGEELGFDAYWLGEHHGSNYIISSPQLVLSAVAVLTRRIRLGTAVSLLPNNDPVRLAEDFATLDLLSNGRAEIGFGGGFTDHTFRLFGQNLNDSAEISDENLTLIQRIWNERTIKWRGKFRAPIEDIELQPRTFSGYAIPINRATATSVATARHAGRSGHKLMLMTVAGTFADAKPLAEEYRSAYRQAEHDPAGMSVSALVYIHVQADGAKAREFWRPYVNNYRAFTRMLTEQRGLSRGIQQLYQKLGPEKLAVREADFCGDPQEVIDKIVKAYDHMGSFDRLISIFDLGGLPRHEIVRSLDLFARTVMPAVNSALGAKASTSAAAHV